MTGEFLSPTSVITDRALLARIQIWKQLTGRETSNDDSDSLATELLGDSMEIAVRIKDCYGDKAEELTTKDDALLLAFESAKSVTRNTPAA